MDIIVSLTPSLPALSPPSLSLSSPFALFHPSFALGSQLLMFSAAFSLIFFSWKNIMFKKCVWAPGKQVCLQCFKHFFILMFLCYTDTFPLSKPFDWHQKYLVEKFVDSCVCKRGKRSLERRDVWQRNAQYSIELFNTERSVEKFELILSCISVPFIKSQPSVWP